MLCVYIFFKQLNLYVMIKMNLILELIFRCEACHCIFSNKAAEPYVFFADQTSPTSSAELVEPSKKFGVEKCWRNLLGYLQHFRTFLTGLGNYRTIKSRLFLSCQTLAMILFTLLPMILRSNIVNLDSDAKAIAEAKTG